MIDIEDVNKTLSHLLNSDYDYIESHVEVEKIKEFIEQQQAEIEQLKNDNEWISVDEFIKKHDDIFCYIDYKNAIRLSHFKNGKFYFKWGRENVYMSECIKSVYPLPLPKPPENTND